MALARLRKLTLVALVCTCCRTPQAMIPDECLVPPDAAEAAAAPASAGTLQLSTVKGHRQLAMDPKQALHSLEMPQYCEIDASDGQFVSIVRICVSIEGSVSNVEILKHSAPIVDRRVQEAIGGWRYHPYVVDGQPRAFCYRLRSAFRGRKKRSGWLF